MPLSSAEIKRLETDATMREVYDLRVLVVGGGFPYLKMFFEAGFRGARSVEDASIICFTGGEDVDPALYGEKPIAGTNYNPARDAFESKIYAEAVIAKKPMIGICRGGQFLNVMNDGKLYQDVNNHAIFGTHEVVDMRTGKTRPGMTSTHHQMMIPAKDGEVLALAALSTKKKTEKTSEEISTPVLEDTEVVWYPDSLCLCFQPHPEFQHGDCRNYFLELVDEYIIPAC